MASLLRDAALGPGLFIPLYKVLPEDLISFHVHNVFVVVIGDAQSILAPILAAVGAGDAIDPVAIGVEIQEVLVGDNFRGEGVSADDGAIDAERLRDVVWYKPADVLGVILVLVALGAEIVEQLVGLAGITLAKKDRKDEGDERNRRHKQGEVVSSA